MQWYRSRVRVSIVEHRWLRSDIYIFGTRAAFKAVTTCSNPFTIYSFSLERQI